MTIELWVHGACNPALRCGGWAFVRLAAGEAMGVAGGERGVTEVARMELTCIAAGLKDAEPAQPVSVHAASPALIAAARRLAAGGPEAWTTPRGEPLPHPDLWAPIAAAMATRKLAFTPAAAGPAQAFVLSWAELARDRAKDRGAFTSPIPKPNLRKALGLA